MTERRKLLFYWFGVFLVSVKMKNLLRLGKEYFRNKTESKAYSHQQFLSFHFQSLTSEIQHPTEAHTQVLAWLISPILLLADLSLFRLIFIIQTCFLPSVSWHTQHLSMYFYKIWLTSKHCAVKNTTKYKNYI